MTAPIVLERKSVVRYLAIITGMTYLLLVWTVFLLCKNQACIRQLSREGHVSLVVRVCVFGVYLFLGLWYACSVHMSVPVTQTEHPSLNIVSIIDWTNVSRRAAEWTSLISATSIRSLSQICSSRRVRVQYACQYA